MLRYRSNFPPISCDNWAPQTEPRNYGQGRKKPTDSGKDFARELLEFYDQFSELNACCAFVLQAAVRIVEDGEVTDRRSAAGAIYCAQWLQDRMAELEKNLRRIERAAFAASKRR